MKATTSAALLIGGAMVSGVVVGALLPSGVDLSGLTLPALALQTALTVGALPPVRAMGSVRRGLSLLWLHHLCMTLPLAAAGIALGVDTALGFGVFLMAAAPPAALVPAYAEAIDLDVRAVLVFVFVAYAAGLIITPAMLLVVAGTTAGTESVLTIAAVGLILPSLAGRALHRPLNRIPQAQRRRVAAGLVFLITLGLGGDLAESITGGSLTVGFVAATLVILAARTVLTGSLAARLAAEDLRFEAQLAGGFKNIALAAAIAASLFGPVAALPSLLGFFFEAGYVVVIAHRRAGIPQRNEAKLAGGSE